MHDHNIELTPPLFWKDEKYNDFIGFLDEHTVARVTAITPDRISMSNGKPSNMIWDLQEAYNKFIPCSEQEFLDAYEGARESIRLEPLLDDKEPHNGLEETMIYHERESNLVS